jgi:hypothetical protein
MHDHSSKNKSHQYLVPYIHLLFVIRIKKTKNKKQKEDEERKNQMLT